jgi:hypothetical protein
VNGLAAVSKVALSCVLLTAIPLVSAGAQEVVPTSWDASSPASHARATDFADRTEGRPFIGTASMATAGSMTGFAAGGMLAVGAVCWSGCDWDELVMATYVGVLGGATLLSAVGAYVTLPSERSFGGPLLGATLGIAPGILGFIVASGLEDGVQISWVTIAGFAVGQGLTTALFATRRR